MKPWTPSDISKPIPLFRSIFEFSGHEFNFIATPTRIVFGGCTNAGFLESGYIEREEGESLDETLQEMISDLESYYNDGPKNVSRIVCNERM
jgi:hypothetical protein